MSKRSLPRGWKPWGKSFRATGLGLPSSRLVVAKTPTCTLEWNWKMPKLSASRPFTLRCPEAPPKSKYLKFYFSDDKVSNLIIPNIRFCWNWTSWTKIRVFTESSCKCLPTRITTSTHTPSLTLSIPTKMLTGKIFMLYNKRNRF